MNACAARSKTSTRTMSLLSSMAMVMVDDHRMSGWSFPG
jgi:hypothetical protein